MACTQGVASSSAAAAVTQASVLKTSGESQPVSGKTSSAKAFAAAFAKAAVVKTKTKTFKKKRASEGGSEDEAAAAERKKKRAEEDSEEEWDVRGRRVSARVFWVFAESVGTRGTRRFPLERTRGRFRRGGVVL